MRLAISNIAWDVAEDEVIAQLLSRHGIDAIDVAPGKYFPDPTKASAHDISRVRAWWSDRGVEIYRHAGSALRHIRPECIWLCRC